MIVATAGHVDHGKTSLVRALTGIDTDSLQEEKRRGMTIEPGHAHAEFDGVAVAFVDVPGHERFMRQMLAGVAAVDFALLVVAADDGVMPQTREHLAVLDLLGLRRGAVALTKTDRVDDERVAQVADELRALLAGSSLAGSPLFALSAATGAGIEALRRHLGDEARRPATALDAAGAAFRLYVDRVFVRAGAGLVAAGAVRSGSATVGDEVVVSPAGDRARIRAIQVLGRERGQAAAGERAALNLAPLAGERLDLARGDTLLAPALHAPTTRLDVEWRRVDEGPDDARSKPRLADRVLQLHLGAASVQARVFDLAAATPVPGPTRLAQVLLRAPLSVLRGDRFVLRDPAAHRPVGGGRVLDAFAPARGRARPERLAELAALRRDDPQAALAALLDARPQGIDAEPFLRNANLSPAEGAALGARLAVHRVRTPAGLRWVAAAQWNTLAVCIPALLARAHAAQPDSAGLHDAALDDAMRAALPWADAPLRRAAVQALRESGAIERAGFAWRLPGHRARLGADDAALLSRVVEALHAHEPRPPPPGELAPALGLPLADLAAFLERAAALGHLVRVAANRYFLPATVQAMIELARELAAGAPEGRFDVITFRDRSGLGRNLSIQVLEFLDRQRITRRVGQGRTFSADRSSAGLG